MPVLDDWKLELNVDEILHAQGVSPEQIRIRRPKIVSITEEAISLGRYLIKPSVLYQSYDVKTVLHNKIELLSLQNKQQKCLLSGELVGKHLAMAKQVYVTICTIGNELDETVSSLFNKSPLLAIALDGFGSAAVEQLAILASNYFEEQALAKGMSSTIPLNPGMVGWPVEEGQLQIFSLLDSEEINVSLTESLMMVPNKSLSMVIGMGQNLSNNESSCEYCSLKGVCKYQNHYAKQ